MNVENTPMSRTLPSASTFVDTVLNGFTLSHAQLATVRDTFSQRLTAGLARPNQEILAQPAFLSRPSETAGIALVWDWGGTHARLAIVRTGPKKEILARHEIPDFRKLKLTGEQAFDLLAAGAYEMLEKTGLLQANLPMGGCFSFPAEVFPSRDAKLIRWSKGIDIPGVENQFVGALFEQAMRRKGVSIGPTTILNDTIAALFGGADIAGIVATGNNTSGFIPIESIPKMSDLNWSGEMAINFESGAFVPPYLTPFDDRVDQMKEGNNRGEKALSGYYLPYLFQTIVNSQFSSAELKAEFKDFDPEMGSAQLSDLAKVKSNAAGPRVAAKLFERSADLVAAQFAGIATLHPHEKELTIIAEGTLFWSVDGYRERCQSQLNALLTKGQRAQIVDRVPDINLFGSAAAALSPRQPAASGVKIKDELENS